MLTALHVPTGINVYDITKVRLMWAPVGGPFFTGVLSTAWHPTAPWRPDPLPPPDPLHALAPFCLLTPSHIAMLQTCDAPLCYDFSAAEKYYNTPGWSSTKIRAIQIQSSILVWPSLEVASSLV